MANPFDQFDTVQSGNPFDQFDPISDEKKKRSVGEALKDIPASFLTGIGSLAKEPGQLYGLATGDMNPNYTKTGRLISKFAEQMKSPGLKAREEDRARKVAEAEKEGQLSAAATAVGQTIKDPFGLGLSFLAQNAPSMIPALGVGRAVNAGAKVLGATPEIASAIAEYAVKGTMVGQQGTDVGAQAYDDIYQKLIDQKVPPEQANRQAIELARKAALAGAAVSAGSMMLPGANAFAKYAAKVPGLTKEIEQGGIKSLIPESRLMGAVKGGLGEATQEAAEEGGGQVAQNYAMRQIDPTQSLTGGVGQAAGLGALGGASLGVIGGHGQEPAGHVRADVGAAARLRDPDGDAFDGPAADLHLAGRDQCAPARSQPGEPAGGRPGRGRFQRLDAADRPDRPLLAGLSKAAGTAPAGRAGAAAKNDSERSAFAWPFSTQT